MTREEFNKKYDSLCQMTEFGQLLFYEDYNGFTLWEHDFDLVINCLNEAKKVIKELKKNSIKLFFF